MTHQSKNKELISLVIFTCQGRENLLAQTLLSFSKSCIFKFSKTILVIDGPFAQASVENVNADFIVQSPKRRGYVNSISLVLPLIKTPYFFWLEDDWNFPNPVHIDEWLSILEAEPNALQLVLAKDTLNSKYHRPFGGIHQSDLGFSANPSINKTQHIQQAFLALEMASKDESTKLVGFENYIELYRKNNQLETMMIFKQEKAYVAHSGYLESTAREYHMINSIDEENSAIEKEYISGFGYHQKISLRNKLSLIPKLGIAFFWLAIHAFSKRYVYDYGLRVYNSYLKKFKS
jgi:hypothetical protein